MEYPITPEDFSEMHYRMATGQSLTMPVRHDMTLTDGSVVHNVLSWGSPRAYELFNKNDGQLYCRRK